MKISPAIPATVEICAGYVFRTHPKASFQIFNEDCRLVDERKNRSDVIMTNCRHVIFHVHPRSGTNRCTNTHQMYVGTG